MGMDVATGGIPLLNEAMRANGWPLAGLRLLELGNQQFRSSALGAKVAAKRVFEILGAEHTSIDINGQDGALPLDLSRPIEDPKLMGAFDVVTNFGTSEHVSDQLECWHNIYRFVRVGGLVVSSVPHLSYPVGHCEYYYEENFFEALAQYAGFSIEVLKTEHALVGSVLRRSDAPYQHAEIAARLPTHRPGTGSRTGLARVLYRWRKKFIGLPNAETS